MFIQIHLSFTMRRYVLSTRCQAEGHTGGSGSDGIQLKPWSRSRCVGAEGGGRRGTCTPMDDETGNGTEVTRPPCDVVGNRSTFCRCHPSGCHFCSEILQNVSHTLKAKEKITTGWTRYECDGTGNTGFGAGVIPGGVDVGGGVSMGGCGGSTPPDLSAFETESPTRA